MTVSEEKYPFLSYAESDADWQEKVCSPSDSRCVWPGCGSKWESAGHHIFDRRDSKLRLVIENGVCLCGKHHSFIGTAPRKQRKELSILLIGRRIYSILEKMHLEG